MNSYPALNRHLVIFGVPVCLFGILILVMQSSILTGNNTISLAITTDLLLTVPLIYFLLVRRTEIPNTTVVPVMIAGLLLGSYFLPKENQNYLDLYRTWALPVIELSILAFIAYKFRSAVGKYELLKGATPDFFTTLKNTCYDILPARLVIPFATEIAVFYYVFINWKARAMGENEFTYHKKSGTPALLGVLAFLTVVETALLHLLLARWNVTVAWVVSVLSIYTFIQVIGFAKSLSKRPISINQSGLTLRYGILSEAEIPFSDIASIELSGKPLEKSDLVRTLSPLGELESHNVIIYLNKKQSLIGLYGIRKKFNVLGLHLDEPALFKKQLNKACPLLHE